MTNLEVIRYEKEFENVINSHPDIPLEVTRIILGNILRTVDRSVERIVNAELEEENKEREKEE